jgi:thiol-disulfide isomerase/thioredoxin
VVRPLISLLFGLLVCAPLPAQDTSDPVALALQQGSVFESKKKFALALETYRKADKLSHHTSAACSLRMAAMERKLGQLSDALDDAKRAQKLAAGNSALAVQAHMLRAAILVQMAGKPTDKKLKEAEEELRQALALDPEQAIAHFNLGMILLKQGSDAEGISELKAYLESPRATEATREEARKLIANPVRAREPFAPDFSFVTLENLRVSNSSLRGKVILLDFWGTWCEPCREAVPMLRTLEKKFSGPSFLLVGVSSDDDEELVRTFAQAQKMDWQEHVDLSGDLLETFHVESFPTFVVVDKDGVIRFRQSGLGPSSQEDLAEAIGKAIKRPSNPTLAGAVSAEAHPAESSVVSGSSPVENEKAAAPSNPESPLAAFEAATITGNIYKNEALGLVYEFPKGWIPARQEVLHRGNERLEAAMRAALLQQHPEVGGDVPINVPKVVLYASRKGEGDGQRYSIPCLRVLASPARVSALNPAAFQRMVESMATAAGMKVIRPAAPFTVKEHVFLRADFERNSGGARIYEALVQTLSEDYLLQFEIYATSADELQRICETLETVSFSEE